MGSCGSNSERDRTIRVEVDLGGSVGNIHYGFNDPIEKERRYDRSIGIERNRRVERAGSVVSEGVDP